MSVRHYPVFGPESKTAQALTQHLGERCLEGTWTSAGRKKWSYAGNVKYV